MPCCISIRLHCKDDGTRNMLHTSHYPLGMSVPPGHCRAIILQGNRKEDKTHMKLMAVQQKHNLLQKLYIYTKS